MTASSSFFARQPAKGLVFTLATIPFTAFIWVLLRTVFGLDYGPATLAITICFTWYWQVGWAFGGWPANRMTNSRWVRGTINWVILMLLVWGSIALWHWFYGKPFAETQIGSWGSTAIIVGVASLFFFGNSLLLPEELSEKQPLSGVVNTLFAVLFVPFALLLIPQLGGVSAGFYIPWIWFPLTVVVVTYFAGWPFDQLGQPRAGIAYAGATFFLTIVFLAILKKAGTDFFAEGDAGLKAAVFGATWTNVALLSAWFFNNWPLGDLPQPIKGVSWTALSLLISGAVYAVLVSAFDNYSAVLFGSFAFLWAQVSLAAPGLVDVWSLGYEDDPGGAGIGLGEPSPQGVPASVPPTTTPEHA